MSYFFRFGLENSKFPLYSINHIIMILSVVLILLLLVILRRKIKQNKKLEKVISLLIVFSIVIENSLFYGWHLLTHPKPIVEVLPLYTCRLVEVLIVLMILTKNRKFFVMPFYWGILGGISSFILPDVGHYFWPHITYISFYIGHLMIIIGPIYALIIYDFKVTKSDFIFFLKFSYIFYIVTFAINLLIDGNYAFLMAPPIAAQEAGYVPELIPHFLAYTTIYTIISSFFYLVPLAITRFTSLRLVHESSVKKDVII